MTWLRTRSSKTRYWTFACLLSCAIFCHIAKQFGPTTGNALANSARWGMQCKSWAQQGTRVQKSKKGSPYACENPLTSMISYLLSLSAQSGDHVSRKVDALARCPPRVSQKPPLRRGTEGSSDLYDEMRSCKERKSSRWWHVL